MQSTGACIWLCGAPGAGKSTIAAGVASELQRRGIPVEVLDAEPHAAHLVLRLSPSEPASDADLRRLAHVAGLLALRGVIAIVASDAGSESLRADLRARTPQFTEVFVDAPAEICAQRATSTTPASRFEEPTAPDVRVVTHDRTPAASTAQLISHLESIGVVGE